MSRFETASIRNRVRNGRPLYFFLNIYGQISKNMQYIHALLLITIVKGTKFGPTPLNTNKGNIGPYYSDCRMIKQKHGLAAQIYNSPTEICISNTLIYVVDNKFMFLSKKNLFTVGFNICVIWSV